MALESLPTELLVHLMRGLRQPADLKALIRASAHCYRVYKHFKGPVLSSIVRTCIEPTMLPLALRTCDASAIAEYGKYMDPAWKSQVLKLEDMIDGFAKDDTTKARCDRLGRCDVTVWLSLFKLCDTVEFFLEQFLKHSMKQTQYVLQMQGCLPPTGSVSRDWRALSQEERSRLQRAFCRFEIARKLCSAIDKLSGRGWTHYQWVGKAKVLHGDLKVWEEEELTSVYCFLSQRVREIFTAVEDHLVARLKRRKRPRTEDFWAPRNPKGPWTRVDAMGELEEFSLGAFTRGTRCDHGKRIEEIVESGLPSLKELLQQEIEAQKWRFSFPEIYDLDPMWTKCQALIPRTLRQDLILQGSLNGVPFEEVFDDASSGWMWARRLRQREQQNGDEQDSEEDNEEDSEHGVPLSDDSEYGPPLSVRYMLLLGLGDLAEYTCLRDPLEWSHAGYLFWDKARLRCLGFFDLTKDDALHRSVVTYQGCRCRSVEERLTALPIGAKLPAQNLEKALE